MGGQVLPGCFAGTWAARVVQWARPGRYHVSLLFFIPSILPLPFGDCHSGTSSPSFHIHLSRDRAVSCQAASLTELPRKAGLGGWCSFLTAGKLRLRTWSNLPGALSTKKLLLGAEAADSKSSARQFHPSSSTAALASLHHHPPLTVFPFLSLSVFPESPHMRLLGARGMPLEEGGGGVGREGQAAAPQPGQ